ncbi:FAD-dependent oxidoreductase, partial [Desulfotomaculum copahuensis]
MSKGMCSVLTKKQAVLLVPPALLIILLFALFGCAAAGNAQKSASYDIVIYGGGFTGCAAARSAAINAPDRSILLVVPDPEPVLGGIGTSGGQNYFDTWRWHGQLVAGGSFAHWYNQTGQFYNTGAMASLLRAELAEYKNIHILWTHDIEKVSTDGAPARITGLELRDVFRDGAGVIRWGNDERRVTGRVFVDASEDGRLTRLAGVPVTTGRADWPAQYLDPAERNGGDTKRAPAPPAETARQQAATLQFKITGVTVPAGSARVGDIYFTRSRHGVWGVDGGSLTFRDNPVVRAFNDHYAPLGFALKPFNAAQDGPDSREWWVNALLVFNVDGRADQRDRGTPAWPAVRPDGLDTDTAWVKARDILDKPEFIQALRQFSVVDPRTGRRYGLENAALVKDGQGKPVVGDLLYLRETVHLPLNPAHNGNGTENSNYALTPAACQGAGGKMTVAGPGGRAASGQASPPGTDAANYATRIGLGFYAMDINAYSHRDLKRQGVYGWPVTGRDRPDWR